jgi:hypothetical protein
MGGLKLGRVSNGPPGKELEQVVSRGPVSLDRLDGRPENLLVVLQPMGPKVRDRHRLEAEGGWRTGLELPINLPRELAGRNPVGADAGAAALPLVMVTEIPDAAAEEAGHMTDAERIDLRHAVLKESSRHKTPQMAPQTGIPEDVSEWQKAV